MIFPINLDQGYPEKFWPSGAGNTNLEIFEKKVFLLKCFKLKVDNT